MIKKKDKVFKNILTKRRNIDLDTLLHVIRLAVEIAREGREGRKIGTMFIVSDEDKTLKNSRNLILDPLKGHSRKEKIISDSNLRETVKELAQLDGAFIVSDSGFVVSACRYINSDAGQMDFPLGLGARHMAAASITKKTNAVAVVVSESSIVRIIDDGEIVSEIVPELWMLNESSLHLKGDYSENTQEDMKVISKK